MNKPFFFLFTFVGFLFFFSGCKTPAAETAIQYPGTDLAVIPKPLEMIRQDGFFILQPDVLVYSNSKDESLNEYWSDHVGTASGFRPTWVDRAEDASFHLLIDPNLRSLGYEGYALSVKSEQLILRSASPTGLHRGIQTIRQLMAAHFNDPKPETLYSRWAIPNVEITDKPRFTWRGLLLDCCRHFMDKEFVKRYIDLLAFYKMNTLHWHLTEDQGWRIEIEKYPKLTSIGAWRTESDGSRYGGFYSKADIQEIVAYAESRHITVVPEIEMPGHSVAALAAYPHLGCTGDQIEVETEWGVFKDIYCAGNDSTFQFLEDVLTEVMDLFPSDYIHIGGDEAPKTRWIACAKCQKRMADENLEDANQLQAYFIQRIENFLNQHDRKLIGWDEILEGGLAENAAVQSWRGFEGAIEAAKHGNPAVVSPTSHAYFDYPVNNIDLEKVYQFDPIPEGLDPESARMILGGECNMWSERAPQELVDSKVFPRILAMSEVLWTTKQLQNYPDFYRRVQRQYDHLDALNVDYGLESIPVRVKSIPSEKGILLDLKTTAPGTRVKYSDNDGTEINLEQSAPLLSGSGRLKIIPERNGKLYGDTIIQDYAFHQGYLDPIKIDAEYSPNYTASGPQTLNDGLLGSENFKDGHWQGYWDQDIELEIDLGNPQKVEYLDIGALQYNNAWIFFPKEVEYFVALEDGKQIKVGAVQSRIDPKQKEQIIQRYPLKFEGQNVQKIIVKIPNFGACPDWHDASGSPTWLFLDEIIIR